MLSTCLRFEAVVTDDREALEGRLGEVFGTAPDIPGAVYREGFDVVKHLFRVAAGLESPVLGEIEILTQFRGAVAVAKQAGLPPALARLLEAAVACGRSARELLPQTGHHSIAAVAAQIAGGFDRVAVLGAGQMARGVLHELTSLPSPPSVTVAARNGGGVTWTGVEAVPFDRIEELLREFPVVVSATSSGQRLVLPNRLADLANNRSERLTLIDMAMPADFEVPNGSVNYLNIDDLAVRAARKARSDAADHHVEDAAAAAFRRLASVEAATVASALVATAESEISKSVERFAPRLTNPADSEILRRAVHTAVRSVIAEPLEFLGQAEDAEVVTLGEAFGTYD